MFYKIFLISLFSIFLFANCTKDKVEEIESECDDLVEAVVYDGEIASILTTKCSYSPCHDGNAAAPGNYNSYTGLISVTGNGLFTARVIDQMDMPIPGQTAVDLLLTDDELKMIRCWAENDFREQ